ncbi:LytTR family transcriptional regulator DNA-binding domain-containing protein [Pseudobacillus sp. 179-B 2D1 NHS]|uniref:LytTR family transcriptional regulator DNA-binding domain-containing protein n=1 Tax=Pseudobacillus sp. 179-B 2D1 NHS TaxID=3374292 RepID=UPI00387921C0
MSILQISEIEMNKGNTIIFPKIHLVVQKGESVAIQCNSEVGKQLINMIIGQAPLSNGEILLEGLPLTHDFKSIAKRIGIFLLDEALYDRLTPKEYLNFFKKLYNVEVEIGGLLHKVSLIKKEKIKIINLSYSEKKRLQLARAILHQPDLLLMEEPDQNIDIESKIILQRVIEDFTEQGKSVLITTNNFESAISITNHLYRLNEQGLKKIEVIEEENKEAPSSLQEDDSMDLQKMDEETALSLPNDTEQSEEEKTSVRKQLRIEKIPAKMNEKIVLFDPTEIVFVESNEGMSQLHVNGEVFPCSITLNELSDRLQPFGFFRCHRSYIVNLQRVREVITWTRNSYSLILEDSQKSSIPLSKGKLNELKDIIGI